MVGYLIFLQKAQTTHTQSLDHLKTDLNVSKDSKKTSKQQKKKNGTPINDQVLKNLKKDIKTLRDELQEFGSILKNFVNQAKLVPSSKQFNRLESKYLRPLSDYISETPSGLRLQTELFSDHSTSPYVGGHFSRLAMIDNQNYLIGTQNKGFKLYQNAKLISEGKFNSKANYLMGMVYASRVNAYFLLLNKKIYRWSVDGLHKELWADEGFGRNENTPMLYSEKSNRIFALKGTNNIIAVIDPSKKGVEFEMKLDFADYIVRYRTFGENDENVVILTYNRYLVLFKYDINTKCGEIVAKESYPSFRNDYGWSFDLDSKNQNILVTNSYGNGKGGWFLSRILAFELRGQKFVFKSSLDVFDGSGYVSAFRFVRYYKHEAVFIGNDVHSTGSTQIFTYNLLTGNIVKDNRKNQRNFAVYSFDFRFYQGWYYFIGWEGKLMKTRVYNSYL